METFVYYELLIAVQFQTIRGRRVKGTRMNLTFSAMDVFRSSPGTFTFRFPCVLAVVLILAACGTTTTLRQGGDIADAGVAYATAIQSVADLAIEKHVDWIANSEIKERDTPAITGKQLGADLDDAVTSSRLWVREVVIFKAQTQLLGSYFDALGKLTSADVKQPYVDSTKELAGSIDTLGKALQKAGIAKDIHVTDAQQSAAGALAGTVATAVHGEIVAGVLKRDADLIDGEIAIQGAALKHFNDKIASIDRLEVNRLYQEKVRLPFAVDAVDKQRPALPSGWRDDLSIAIKDVQVEKQIADAQSAANKLRDAWRAYLSGKGNASDVLADMTLLRDTATQAQALQAGRH